MQTFTVTMSLPDETDPSTILETMHGVALELAYNSGCDEDEIDENEIENSVNVYVGDALAQNGVK